MLQENEEKLLTMPFEIMLTQVVNLPTRYLIHQFPDQAAEAEAISQFDSALQKLKIPTMLLERLKREFD